MNFTYLFFILILVTSCIIEKSSNTQTFFKNSSQYDLRVIPYSLGIKDTNGIIIIPKGERILMSDKTTGGKGKGYSYAVLLTSYDSVLIVTDSFESVYYRQNISGSNSNAILYNSSKSIYNESNYILNVKDETKYKITNEYIFELTNSNLKK